MTPTRSVPTLILAVLLAAASLSASRAQDPGDDALDRLLKKVEEPAPPVDDRPAAGKGDVSAGDQDLDSLLKKLGDTPDEPSAKGKPMPPGADPGEPAPAPDGSKPSGPSLEGREKALDEHLEELTGRRKKKKDGDSQDGQKGDDSGPLSEAIKKMEEARKRLSESDTGEGTRKTQGEIVKELDQILQQIRRQGQGSGKRMAQRTKQAGQGGQPGDQPGDQPGNTGAGVGASAPKKPTVGEMLSGRKDTWGDLPPNLREEMENVFKEDMLPAKRDLIIRYYSSVARKGRAREESSR